MKSNTNECSKADLMAVRDAMEVLNGKWKLQILIALFSGKKRFKQVASQIDGISDRMLSVELKHLEENKLITRTVLDAFPPVVEYDVTKHTHSLNTVIDALRDWGYLHRSKIMEK